MNPLAKVARLTDLKNPRTLSAAMTGGTVALGNLLIGPVVSALGITDVLIFGAGVALILGLLTGFAAA